ncbi:hypothetical protein H1Z61_17580 [Bacillus aquiflavi]|uniref:Uncharacterized protein n=1 Tax=Bacillus aquiflavi TaxID=2672567 RepID=A0A6B3W5I7_9BACI|nr:hypothetical protein [Bacillus aquiflavi]MBA4538854.1 hypothetical protein [Bacillus aquiflavi]NEY83213.1 hypothetical protein [Bacillus aquiflavi]
MPIIKKINWIDEHAKEADVIISDGEFSLKCFSCPFELKEGQEFEDYIYCLDIQYVYVVESNKYVINQIDEGYEHILQGKLIDIENKILRIGKLQIDISNGYIPKDILKNQFIEVKVSRLDLY